MNNREKNLCIALLCIANVLNYVDRVLLQTILTDVKNFFVIENTVAGLFQTVFYISYVVSSIIYGALGDFTSRKNLIVFGIILWSVSELIGSFVPKNMKYLFFVSRVFFGIGQSGISHLGIVFIGDIYSDAKRTRCISLFLAGIPLGSGLGFIIAKQIATTTGDWRWVFRVTPIMSLCVAILIAIFIKEPTRGYSEILKNDEFQSERLLLENNIVSSESESFVSNRIEHLNFIKLIKDTIIYIFMKKSFLTNTVAYTLMNFSLGALAFWMPHYLELLQENFPGNQGYISDKNQMGLIFGILVVVAGFLAVIIPSEISARYWKQNRPIELFICLNSSIFASLTLFLCLILSVKNFLAMWVVMFLTLFFFSAIWLPHGDMIMHLIMPKYRARASSFESIFIHVFGDALSPLIVGIVADKINNGNLKSNLFCGIYIAFFICPFVTILAGIFYSISLFNYFKDIKSTQEEIELMNTGHP